ncbi:hypothetical protein DRO53_04160 [Candidatus Bathyarchaeota archaeon]|nr:MAG: hypothetical protein DRO53_04160 [Candidatus Bathyarchaeota archaeon]
MDNPSKLLPVALTTTIILLLLLTVPAAAPATNYVTVNVRIESLNSGTIWYGKVTLPDSSFTVTATSGNSYTLSSMQCPLGALEKASQQGGFSYQLSDAWISWDLFVSTINNDGNIVYFVNGGFTNYGAGYGWLNNVGDLDEGDEVLWFIYGSGYTGSWDYKPLKIEVNSERIPYDGTLEVTVKYATGNYPNPTWSAASGVRVKAGNVTLGTTNSSGLLRVNVKNAGLNPGSYEVYAEPANASQHYIRSNRITIEIYSPGGYTEEQRKALNQAKEVLDTSGNVAEAYQLLLSKGIISKELPTLPASLYTKLAEIYGPNLERFPSFEGRIQLLYAFGITSLTG